MGALALPAELELDDADRPKSVPAIPAPSPKPTSIGVTQPAPRRGASKLGSATLGSGGTEIAAIRGLAGGGVLALGGGTTE
jgi:hypothetical protein